MPVSPTVRQSIPAPTRVTPPANTAPTVNGANGDALRWLNTLGRLPKNFDGAVLVRLLEGDNPKLRQLAATNLGKLSDTKFLPPLLKVATSDANTAVRREATAAIGRMRDQAAIPALAKLTN